QRGDSDGARRSAPKQPDKRAASQRHPTPAGPRERSAASRRSSRRDPAPPIVGSTTGRRSPDRLLSTSLPFGCWAIGLVLAQQSTLTTALRAALLLLGSLCLVVYWFRGERAGDRRYSATSTLLNVLAFFVGVIAWQTGHAE